MQGIFLGCTKRNEKTGYSLFTIKTKDLKLVRCAGIIPNYPKYIPIAVYCEDENNDTSLYNVNSAKIMQMTIESTIDFLCSKTFIGSGPSVVHKLLQKINNADIFALVREDNLPNTPFTKTEKDIIAKIAYYISFEKTYEYIKHIGGEYYEAHYMFENYGGQNAIKKIKENPYILLKAKTPFYVCDNAAKDIGIEECDIRRTFAIVSYVIDQVVASGSTYITIDDLFKRIKRIEEKTENGYTTEPVFILEAILSDKYILEEADNTIKIYPKNEYIIEEKIVEQISRLNSCTGGYDISPSLIRTIEEECNITYAKEQISTFNCLKTPGLKIITGGPGTGKTTVLNGIIKLYERINPNGDIVLCAPTSHASIVMSEATGKMASTIHRLLKIMPYENFLQTSVDKINGDLILIDEGSMIDMYLFFKLLSSIKNNAIVILLGDSNQLPSVNAGAIFRDVIKSGCIETYKLDVIFRQAEDNLIIRNSRNVINGISKLDTDKHFLIKTYNSSESLVNATVDYVNKFKNANRDDYKVYSSCKKAKYETGTINLNRLLKNDNSNTTSFEYGFNTFSVGDKVIFSRNNYEKKYFNGLEGTIVFIQSHSDTHYVTIRTEEDTEVTISGNDLDDIELGYAITAHKSQGSECNNAIIVIAKEPAVMLKRQLLYVEITRAKKNVIILEEEGALKTTISSYGEFTRNTGLCDKIKKTMLKK